MNKLLLAIFLISMPLFGQAGGGGTSGGTSGQMQMACSTNGWFCATSTTQYSVGSSVEAVSHINAAGAPVFIEIFSDATNKPNEGNAAVTGTVAWAAAQLTSGGQIFVHEGAYTVATTITLSIQGTSLFCANPNTTTFSAGAAFNSDLFHIGYAGAQRQGMNVENCGFNGTNGSNTTGVQLHIRDVANSTFRNNYFKFATIGGGITMDATVTGIVQDNILDNFFQECVQECLIITNAAGQNPTDDLIRGNQIGGSSIGDGTKPWVTYTDIGGVQFLYNHISGPGHTTGATFTSASQSHSVINDNIFETINQNCLTYNGSNTTFTGNSFYACGQSGSNTYEDLYTVGGTNLTITGNVFDGGSNSKYGVFTDQAMLFSTVTGNVFLNHTSFAISANNDFAGGNVFSPNVFNGNGGTVQQSATHFPDNTVSLQTTTGLSAVPGQISTNGLSTVQLANGPTPAITNQGSAGAATWSYVIVPKDINGNPAAAGSVGSTTTGNATLTGSNYNVITWTKIAGTYSYDVYRTAHGTTPSTNGLIGNVLSTATLSGNGSLFLNDTALAGDSSTAPAINSSGGATILGPVVSGNSKTMTGAGTVTSTSFVAFTTNTLTLPLIPANTTRRGECALSFQGSLNTVTPSFAINTSATLTGLYVMGVHYYFSTAAIANTLPIAVVTTATATPIASNLVLAAGTTSYEITFEFTAITSSNPQTVSIFGKVNLGTLTVDAGSGCSWL